VRVGIRHRPVARIADDPLLPDEPARDAVLAGFDALLELGASEAWTTAPLLEPTPRCFPDPWRGGTSSLEALLRRLAIHAGLVTNDPEDLTFAITVERPRDDMPKIGPDGGMAFEGLTRDDHGHPCARIVVQEVTLRDAKWAGAVAARTVAAIWIARRDAMRSGGGTVALDANGVAEQRRIDLASIVLGFGVLTTDASLQYVAGQRGGRKLGVTPAPVMAFALAVWSTSRGSSAQAHKQIAGRLGTTQSRAYLAASRWLNEEVEDVADVVGLPPRETWAPARRLDDLLEAFPPATVADETPVEEDRGVVGRNVGKPVFRLERRLTSRLFRLVIPAAFLLGGALSRLGASTSLVVPALAGCAIVMLMLSALVKESICSDPRCGARLDEKAETCSRCGGLVAGTIRDPRERLAAEEAWVSRHAVEADPVTQPTVALETTVAAPQPTGGGGGSAMNSAPLPPG